MTQCKKRIPWNKGMKGLKASPCTEKRKEKLRKEYKSEGNPNWKGDKVGYVGIHLWVKRHLEKPKRCENCRRIKRLDLANISGKYLRDLTDWEWLCRRCHMIKDGRLKKFKMLSKNKTKIWINNIQKSKSKNNINKQ